MNTKTVSGEESRLSRSRETGRVLICLLRAALEGAGLPGSTAPPEGAADAGPMLPAGVTMEAVFEAAKHHELECMAYAAAAKLLRASGEEALLHKWREAAYRRIYQSAWQIREEERLCQSYEAAGIRIMPLKGNRIRRWYPESAWRQMADLDFLILEEDAGRAAALMRSLGYRADTLGEVHHDVYYSRDGGMVEIHRALARSNAADGEAASLEADSWEGAGARAGFRYVFEQDEESFFRYFLMHFQSHFNYCGIGIRPVLDLWLCRQRKQEPSGLIDQLRQDGLAEFYLVVSDIADAWFGGEQPDFDRVDPALEAYMLRSGAKGMTDQIVANRMAGNMDDFHTAGQGRAGYLLRRLFPGPEVMQGQFPGLKKRRYLLPAYWIFRIVRQLAEPDRRHKLRSEARAAAGGAAGRFAAPDMRKLAEELRCRRTEPERAER